MATLLRDLRSLVREGLDEPVAIVWSDNELLHYIQGGISILWKLAIEKNPEMISRRDAVSFAAGEDFVTLPYVPLKVLQARCNSSILEFRALLDLPTCATTGDPRYCSLSGMDQLTISPAPKEAISVVLYGIDQLPTLGEEDESPFPPITDELVVDWALVRAYNRDEAIPQLEMQFVSQHQADIARLFEERDPALVTGRGPWTV